MKFTTETTNLKEAIARVGHVVNSRSVLPTLQSILVTLANGQVELTASDLQITVTYGILCDVEGEGQFLMPYLELKNLLALSHGEVVVGFEETKGVTVLFDKDVFCLGNQGDTKDFPKVPKVAEDRMFTIDNSFFSAIKKASTTTLKDEMYPAFCSVCIDATEDATYIVATDKNVLFSKKLPPLSILKEATEVLLPSNLAKILDESIFEKRMGFNKKNIRIESGPVTIVAKLVDAKYPAWRMVLPEHNANVEINLNDFENSIAKAFVLSDDSAYNAIDLFISAESMGVKTIDKNKGMSSDISITATSTCNVEQVRISGRYLKRIGSLLDEGADMIEFSITEKNKAVTVKSVNDDTTTLLIMPIIFN